MNELSKIDMANLVFSEDKKAKIKDILCSFYGATDVQYKSLNYGICIEISGTDSFRFIKNAIGKVLEVSEDTLSVLGENKKSQKASYVYLPEKDKALYKKLKKSTVNK
jgi:hypothetical protein